MKIGSRFFVSLLLVFIAVSIVVDAATVSTRSLSRSKAKKSTITENPRAQKKITQSAHSRTVAGRKKKVVRVVRKKKRVVRRYYERFTGNSYALEDQTNGDLIAGEDPTVRQAAIEALGNMNGTVLAIDPNSGRILAMVNQRMALDEGATPCSTIKLSVALAALREGVVTKDEKVKLTRTFRMNLTDALAHSNNTYFEVLGRRLGFEKVSHYAHQFGLGELAGYNITGEHLGTYPTEPLADNLGGVGKMCSFGESISMTPLQLGAMVAAIANGGTLYYLQHPRTPEEVVAFQPRIKRHLDIDGVLPEISDGMAGAVRYGTAKSVRYSFSEEQILGKTGTCSKDGVRFGWFASYANTNFGKIVVVVFLKGGRPTFGPKAAELSGKMYRSLYDHSFFASKPVLDSRVQTVGAVQ